MDTNQDKRNINVHTWGGSKIAKFDMILKFVQRSSFKLRVLRAASTMRNMLFGLLMIGAMPSLALDRSSTKQQGSIGHLNRKNLSLHFRPPVLTSSQSNTETGQVNHHCANKRLMFQLSVLAPLAGALLLFVGLVQLIPGADGEAFSLPLILIGSVILFLGLTIIVFRLFCSYEIQEGPTTTTTTTITTTAPQQDPEIKIDDVER